MAAADHRTDRRTDLSVHSLDIYIASLLSVSLASFGSNLSVTRYVLTAAASDWILYGYYYTTAAMFSKTDELDAITEEE
jgi:hypothetical protein